MDFQRIINKIKEHKWLIIIIILILLLAFVLRLIPIKTYHWWDETVYLQQAEVLFSGRTNYDEFSFRPPLLSILFFLIFFIKHSVVSASILTAVMGTITSVFIFLIGKKLYNAETGIIAGLIIAFTPFIVKSSNFLLTDVPAITLTAISFYLFLLNNKKLAIFFSGVFFSLAVLMKFTAVLMGLVFLVYFFVRKSTWKQKINEIVIFAIGSLIIIMPYLIWAQINLGSFLTPFIKGQSMVGDTNEPKLFYFYNFVNAFGIITIIGLALWIIFSLINLSNKKTINLRTNFILVFWIVLFLIYLTKVPHKELRYIFPIAIPVILLASNGISLLINKVKKQYKILIWLIFIGYLIFLISNTYALENITNGRFVDNFIGDEMKIADYLNETNYSGIIYTNTRWPVFAYYTNLKIKLLMPWNEKFYDSYSNVMNESGILIGIFDEKHPQPAWLNKNSHFKYAKEIGEFFIYRYTPQ